MGIRGGTERPRVDGLMVLVVIFLVLAAAFLAYPAIKAGPSTGGLMLLAGLAGVAVILAFAIKGGKGPGESAEALLDALAEPACLASADGRVRAANAAWREAVGAGRRLPKTGGSAASLFAALTAARRGGSALARVWVGGGERTATVSRLDAASFLVRLVSSEPLRIAAPDGQAEAAQPADLSIPSPPPPPRHGPAITALDPFADAAPFGAALLEGPQPETSIIAQANGALVAMAGEGARVGRAFWSLIHEGSQVDAAARIGGDQSGPIEVRLAGDPARVIHLYLTRRNGGFVAYLVDVSAQKQVELQLAQSQKMQAIGQLAGGVAHDFNNLLMAIELRIDELLQRHPVGDPSYEGLSQIRQTGARAADLVRKLLAFSRKQTVQRVTLDVGELISEFQVLLGRLLPEDVKLDTHYGKDLPQVRADKSQLETAVMNLVLNARDAVRGQAGGGVIRVETDRLTHAVAQSLGYADPKASPDRDVALIEVSDNGPGIPAGALGDIFDPFFTTKPVGEGTGLGLSTVYGIVKQADGWIHVESPPGKGATFRIFLPVFVPPVQAAAPAAPAAAEPVKPRVAARDLSGAGRILFVEDEDAVRGVAARLLRARGYEVIEAADGEEALVLAEQHAGEIDLLISDVIMPGMDGPTLLKKARDFLGTAPVMFISGYAEADFSNMLEGEEGVTFLPKPIDIKTLAERVKQQLAAA